MLNTIGKKGVSMHTMKCNGKTVRLIDTPGFDDSHRSDADVLQELAYWLVRAHEKHIKISGIVYLHRITDPRLQGSHLRGLDIFKKMCGTEAYSGIVMATTRWDKVSSDDGNRRQAELRKKREFWGEIREGGGNITTTSSGKLSAKQILQHIVRNDRRLTLQIQREMGDLGFELYQTAAGNVLYSSWMVEKMRLETQMNVLRSKINSEVTMNSTYQARALEDDLAKFSKEIDERGEALNKLRIPAQKLVTSWDEKGTTDLENLRTLRRESEQSLAALKRKQNDDTNWGFEDFEERIQKLEKRIRQLRTYEGNKMQTYSPVINTVTAAAGVIGPIAAAILPILIPAAACTIM